MHLYIDDRTDTWAKVRLFNYCFLVLAWGDHAYISLSSWDFRLLYLFLLVAIVVI